MENSEIYRSDNRTLKQLMGGYLRLRRRVKEKRLDKISAAKDLEQLSEADRQALVAFNADKRLFAEVKRALDFVAGSTIFNPNGSNPCVQMLLSCKTEYAHAVVILTYGFDRKWNAILETVDDSKSFDRSFANAVLYDETIVRLIREALNDGTLEAATVADLMKVVSDTKVIRDNLHIRDDSVIDDIREILMHDRDKLVAYESLDCNEQEREGIEFV